MVVLNMLAITHTVVYNRGKNSICNRFIKDFINERE